MLLTILIPTIGRVDFLYHTLSTFINSIRVANLEKNTVEILVMDNFSKDGTAEMVQKLASEYDCIRYKKHEQYYPSAEESLFNGFPFANGEYVWSYGDDDFVYPEALEKVIKCLLLGDIDGLFINGTVIKGTEMIAINYVEDGLYVYNKTQDIFYDFGFTSGMMACMSSLCFRKSLLDVNIMRQVKEISPIYSYYFAIFVLLYNRKSAVLGNKIFCYNLNNEAGQAQSIYKLSKKIGKTKLFSWNIGLYQLFDYAVQHTGADIKNLLNVPEYTRQYTNGNIWYYVMPLKQFITTHILHECISIRRMGYLEIIKKYNIILDYLCFVPTMNSELFGDYLDDIVTIAIKQLQYINQIKKFGYIAWIIYNIFTRKKIKKMIANIHAKISLHNRQNVFPAITWYGSKSIAKHNVSQSLYYFLRNDEFYKI